MKSASAISNAFATSWRISSPCGVAVRSRRKKPEVLQDSYSASDSAPSADRSFLKEILESWAVGTSLGKGGYSFGGKSAIAQIMEKRGGDEGELDRAAKRG